MEHIKELLASKLSRSLYGIFSIPEEDIFEYLLKLEFIELLYLDKGIKTDLEYALQRSKEIFGIKSMDDQAPGQLTLGM
ncbi:MAG: hypothetical protein N4A40_13215 [Tissierellales bacterium]|jgi:hypothetical protein|nr:hypothetical protein [Tissierellales bacterium]